MIITYNPAPEQRRVRHLTREEIARIEARAPKDEEITYDEDCPPMTEEQLLRFKRVNEAHALAEPSVKYEFE